MHEEPMICLQMDTALHCLPAAARLLALLLTPAQQTVQLLPAAAAAAHQVVLVHWQPLLALAEHLQDTPDHTYSNRHMVKHSMSKSTAPTDMPAALHMPCECTLTTALVPEWLPKTPHIATKHSHTATKLLATQLLLVLLLSLSSHTHHDGAPLSIIAVHVHPAVTHVAAVGKLLDGHVI
jgi:hypothetical protein